MPLSITRINQVNPGSFFKFNDQPILRGYGGFRSEVPNFKDAIDAGVCFFDGALGYKDAPKIREALKGKDVSQFVLSSKIPGFKLDSKDFKGSTERCFKEITDDLGVDKLPILYLHGPDCIHKDVLDTLVQLKNEGKIEHIGLCNVDKKTVEALVKAGYPISVVQNEFNPYFWDEEALKYCQDNNIVVVGYRPYGDKEREKIFKEATFTNIVERVKSSVQAVILQWMFQKGVTSIPHSNNDKRILENALIPAWTLTQDEMNQIDSIKQGKGSTCIWQEKVNKDLLKASNEWIATL